MEQKKRRNDWGLRFIKGMFIGSGFILPGVSGGALAAIFGIYERIISFLAHLTRNFKENVLFFIPVGLGGITGVFLLSFLVSFLLGAYETIILWFFVGCIIGTLPSLFKEAKKHGRTSRDWLAFAISFVIGFLFLWQGAALFTEVDQNLGTWTIAGGLIGLGMIVPGLSPSNFLVYMGMYKAMSDGIKTLDIAIVLPIAIGGIVTVLVFSKLVDFILSRWYALFFHVILGIVLASTVMIIPIDYAGVSALGYVSCVILLGLGIALGAFMSRLEEQYK